MSNFTITMMWGESPEPDATPKTYSFNTIPERDAFILGIKEMDGWQGYDVLEQKDIGPLEFSDLPLLDGYIQAIFEYDATRVCETCKTNDQVHYNMFVRHGDDYTNEDPEADIWCQKCGETSMDDPEDEEEDKNDPSIFINGKNMTSEEFSAYQRNWMNENTND